MRHPLNRPPEKPVAVLFAAAYLACLLPIVGCKTVRVEEQPYSAVTLMVARNPDEAVLTWSSRKGEVYTILFAESRGSGARWQPLPQASRVIGTGETITVRDRIPADQPRYYRILARPASGRRP